jgi:hypothetical protein
MQQNLRVGGFAHLGFVYVWKKYCGNCLASECRLLSDCTCPCGDTCVSTQGTVSASFSHSVATWVLYDTHCTSPVPFTPFGTNLWHCILIVSGRGNVCDDEEPKDKNKTKVISLSESGGTGKFGHENKPCCGWTQLWCTQI